jgi:flagellar assembly protein FliH
MPEKDTIQEMEADGEDDFIVHEIEKNGSLEEQATSIIIGATRKSESIIKDAKNEAAIIIQNAKIQAEKEGEAIIESKRTQGYNEGLDQAKEEGEAIKAEAKALLDEAIQARKNMEASLEPDIIEMIQKIVNKLLNDAVQIEPQVIVHLIKQGFANTTVAGDITIHVSPFDYDVVLQNKETFLAMADGSVRLEIVKDFSLNEMDCIIETSYGNIDCSLGQQFDALKNNLIFILNNA